MRLHVKAIYGAPIPCVLRTFTYREIARPRTSQHLGALNVDVSISLAVAWHHTYAFAIPISMVALMSSSPISISLPSPKDSSVPEGRQQVSEDVLWFPSEGQDFTVRFSRPEEESQQRGDEDWQKSVCTRLKIEANADSSHGSAGVMEAKVRVKSGGQDFSARALITNSADCRFVSMSLRLSGSDKMPEHGISPVAPQKFVSSEGNEETVGPPFRVMPPATLKNAKFFFSPDAVSDVLLEKLGLLQRVPLKDQTNSRVWLLEGGQSLKALPDRHGLIVIAGSTGTGKSTYATGLALRYALGLTQSRINELEGSHQQAIRKLEEKSSPTEKEQNKLKQLKDANPLSALVPAHIVTFENPIEEWRLRGTAEGQSTPTKSIDLLSKPATARSCGLWLTARGERKDVNSLRDACRHALRQKPSVVYIGEVRTQQEWEAAITLGGTGHLVITTCHSGSLEETFAKLAGKQQLNSQGRRSLADSLRGVIHLKNLPLERKALNELHLKIDGIQTYATAWRNQPESVNNYVVDGLSAIVPDGTNVHSRHQLAKEICAVQHDEDYPYQHLVCDGLEECGVRDQLVNLVQQAAAKDDRRA